MKTFLTYDYELFTGDVCGSIQNCLTTPLKEILPILDFYQAKATFFVDAAFLVRLKELKNRYDSLNSQYELLVDNIRYLEKLGHDVELHIHPQWYYSSYNGINWKMDLDHFKLSDMERELVDERVTKSKQLLEEIIGRETHAFRAGGYSIQDLSNYDDFYRYHHLVVDSTVLTGLKFDSENQKYDYSMVKSNSPYRFSKDITVEDIRGDVLEVPITTYAVSKLQYFEHLLHKKRHSSLLRQAGDGHAIVPADHTLYSRAQRILNRDNYFSASFDNAGGRWIRKIFDRQVAANMDMVVICHPKLHTKYSARKMKEFFEYAKEKTEFWTMSQLVNMR